MCRASACTLLRFLQAKWEQVFPTPPLKQTPPLPFVTSVRIVKCQPRLILKQVDGGSILRDAKRKEDRERRVREEAQRARLEEAAEGLFLTRSLAQERAIPSALSFIATRFRSSTC